MYLDHFGLREQPFGVTPDPRFLYWSESHREAMASLRYGIDADRGFLAVIARPGMGKTTLLFQLLEQVQDSARTAFVFNTQCGPRDLLRYVLHDAGVNLPDKDDVVLLHEEFNTLLTREAEAGKRFIVVVDEAQNLEYSGLEALRLLSNFETPRAKLLQIVLSGQPQLAEKLSTPELAQLRQRLSMICRLLPLTPSEVHDYVIHRLRAAGSPQPEIFSDEAIQLIAQRSEGIPRNINNLCFNSLTTAFAMDRDIVTSGIVREVVADLDLKGILAPPQYEVIDDSAQTARQTTFAVKDGVLPELTPITKPATMSAAAPLPGPVAASASSGAATPARMFAPEAPAVRYNNPLPPVTDTQEKTNDPSAQWREKFLATYDDEEKESKPKRTVSPAFFATVAILLLVVAGAGVVILQWGRESAPPVAQTAETSVAKPESDVTEATPPPLTRRASPRAQRSVVRFTTGKANPSGPKPLASTSSVIPPPEAKPATAVARTDSITTATGAAVPHTDVSETAANSNTSYSVDEWPASAAAADRNAEPATSSTPVEPAPGTERIDNTPRKLPLAAAMTNVVPPAGAVPERSVREGKLVNYTRPEYPLVALQARVQGQVVLRAVIGADGTVKEATHVSGLRLLSGAAIDAVKKWKYEPFLVDGKPTEIEKQITVNFSIPQE